MNLFNKLFRKDDSNALSSEEKKIAEEICKPLDNLYEEVIRAKTNAGNITEINNWSKVAPDLAQLIYRIQIESLHEFLKSKSSQETYKGVDRNELFHEMLILRLWIIDIVYSEDTTKYFMNSILETHFQFHNLEKQDQEIESQFIKERFETYHNLWDMNGGGRQFGFALVINNYIFGKLPANVDIKRSVPMISFVLLMMKQYFILKLETKNKVLNIGNNI